MKTIIIHEFSKEELLKFIKLYRQLEKEKLLPETIIATTTNSSLQMQLKKILEDLANEHRAFT